MRRDDLVSYLAEFLAVEGGDYGPNGLQVQGRSEVRTIVTGVSAGVELFDRALEIEADAILVHHGIFWDGQPYPVVGPLHARLARLFEGEINLLAYHLPLDRHPEIGNNVLAARAFGLEELDTFARHLGHDIGFHGRFPEPISATELIRRCAEIYQREPLAFAFGPDPVSSLGIISGGAQKDVHAAIGLGLDAFITGEVSEWNRNVAQESGIHFLSCGHYATEVLGIRAVGEHLARTFDVEVHWVDIPNPV